MPTCHAPFSQRFCLFFIFSAFTSLLYAQPTITSFSPETGLVGSTVVIQGSNFGFSIAGNIVYFGAVRAQVTSASNTTLTVLVPAGATYNPISVTTNNLTAYSTLPFIVTTATGGASFVPGSFTSPVSFATQNGAAEVAPCDVDGDGKPDMVCTNTGSNTLSIFRNTSVGEQLAFANRVDFPAGLSPKMVTMGDIDGDGKPDAVVPNYNSATVSVFKNNSSQGSVVFAAKLDFAAGNGPGDVSINDVNGDGKPDIVTTNYGSGSISVLRNTSSGNVISFAAKIDFPAGSSLQLAKVADLNNDGKPELVYVMGTSGTVSVLPNLSAGADIAFGQKVDFFTGTSPYNVTVGDIDRDGKPDLVIGCIFTVTVLRNISSGGLFSFVRSDHSSSGSYVFVTISDLDGDGKPDLTISNFGNARITLMRNVSSAGAVSFEPAVHFSIGNSPFGNAVCDLNGDGLGELMVANKSSNTISIRRNTTNNTNFPNITSFSPSTAGNGMEVTITGNNLGSASGVSFGGVPASSFVVVSPTTVKAVVGAGASGNLQVNTPAGNAVLSGFTYTTLPTISSFSPSTGGHGSEILITGTNFLGATSVRFGEVAASGFQVISYDTIRAFVDTGSTGSVTVVNAFGSISKPGFVFNKTPQIVSFVPEKGSVGTEVIIKGTNLLNITNVAIGLHPVASFVVNSPTQITAVVGQVSEGSMAFSVSGPHGQATLPGFYTGAYINGFSPTSGAAGTVVTITGANFSTTPSLNTVFFGGVKAAVLASTATTLQVAVPLGATYDPLSVTKNNLTAFADRPFTLRFPNTSNHLDAASFNPNNVFKTEAYPIGVAAGDIDGDGKADIVVCNQGSTTVSVYRNITSDSVVMFYPKQNLDAGDGPFDCLLKDFSGDGKLDVLVVNSRANTISLFKNLSTPGQVLFSSKIDYPTGNIPQSVAVGDFNGDGLQDVLVGNSSYGGVTLLKNTGSGNQVVFEKVPLLPQLDFANGVSVADYNADGKPDIAVSNYESVIVYKNTSRHGVFSFDDKLIIPAGFATGSIFSADYDGDGMLDIAALNRGNNNFSVFINAGNSNQMKFLSPSSYSTNSNNSYSLKFADISGDGKPDAAVANFSTNSVGLFLNKSQPGTIGFDSTIKYPVSYAAAPRGVAFADFDNDGKTDVVASNSHGATMVIFRNTLSEPRFLDICPLNLGADIITHLKGATFQWQADTGSGFVNIQENGYYSGVNQNVLHVSVPTEWYGYRYRCVVDGVEDEPVTVRLVNNWVGGVDNNWHNYQNWSCGSVPDLNTDVIIKSGNIVINSNAACRTLLLVPGVNFTVNPGITFTVTR